MGKKLRRISKKQVQKRQRNSSKVIRGGSTSGSTSGASALPPLHYKTLNSELSISPSDLEVYNKLWVEVLDIHKVGERGWRERDERRKQIGKLITDFIVMEAAVLKIFYATGLPLKSHENAFKQANTNKDGLTKREFFTYLKLIALEQAGEPVNIVLAAGELVSMPNLTTKTPLPIIGSSTSETNEPTATLMRIETLLSYLKGE